MQEKTMQVPKTKQVTIPDGTQEIKIYVADDGKEFKGINAKQECLNYESTLHWQEKLSKLNKIDLPWSTAFPYTWYMAKTSKDLPTLIKILDFDDTMAYVDCDDKLRKEVGDDYLVVGEWYTSIFTDGGDSRDSVEIFSWSYLKTLFKELEKQIHDKSENTGTPE